MIRVVVQRKDDRGGWRDVFWFADHEHRIGRRVRYRIRPRMWRPPTPDRPPPR